MDNSHSVDTFIEAVSKIAESYGPYDGSLSGYAKRLLEDLVAEPDKLRKQRDLVAEPERQLRIGIIGQTNVGKSSLLNALFFDCNDVLPKAATPMTAALTLIHYGETPRAEVTFYNTNEWDELIGLARTAERKVSARSGAAKTGKRATDRNTSEGRQSPTDERSNEESLGGPPTPVETGALEVVRKAPPKPEELLNSKKLLEGETATDLLGRLEEYAGAAGRFTSLVKQIDIYMRVEALKDISVVDTPGINDPIVSRSNLTRKYLGQCDVILILSFAGSFLDQTDLDLIVRTLPSEAVKAIRVVATKMDSAIVSENRRAESIFDVAESVAAQLGEIAAGQLAGLLKNEGTYQDRYKRVADSLKRSLPVIYISTMCHQIAEHWGHLSEEENHVYGLINKVAPTNPLAFRGLGNLEEVHEYLRSRIPIKEQILNERLNGLLPAAEQRVEESLRGIRNDSATTVVTLRNSNVESLRKQLSAQKQSLEICRARVESSFNMIIGQMLDLVSSMLTGAQESRAGYNNLSPKMQEKTETYFVRKGGALNWLKDKFKPGSAHEERTRKINEIYLGVDEAIDHLQDYAQTISAEAAKGLNDLFNRRNIAGQIKLSLSEGLDLGSLEFSVESMESAVDGLVLQIPFPEINLSSYDYNHAIMSNFGGIGIATGSDMQTLRKALDQSLKAAEAGFGDALKVESEKFQTSLAAIRDSFVEKLKTELTQRTTDLEEQLKDREASIERHKAIAAQAESDLRTIKKGPDRGLGEHPRPAEGRNLVDQKDQAQLNWT
jgi:hypothetical protein